MIQYLRTHYHGLIISALLGTTLMCGSGFAINVAYADHGNRRTLIENIVTSAMSICVIQSEGKIIVPRTVCDLLFHVYGMDKK